MIRTLAAGLMCALWAWGAQADLTVEEAFAQAVIQPAPQGPEFKTVRIAVVHPAMQGSDFWNRAVCAMGARLSERGIRYELDLYESARNEVRKQISQLQQALADNPDYLLFHLDSVRHQAAIEQLLTLQKPKVILQNITTPVEGWQTHPLLYSGFDHETGSRLLAEAFIDRVGTEGRYAVIYGPQGHVAQMRGEGFIKHIQTRSNLKLAGAYYTQANDPSGLGAAQEILTRYPDIKFIYACSTDTALGAAEAIAQKGLRSRVLINGWGGGSAELAALSAGRLDLTVMRMNDDHGAAMADAIALDLAGQGDRIPKVFSGRFVLIQKGISQSEMERLRGYAFRYSGL